MPVPEAEVKSSWADEVEEGDGMQLPPPQEKVEKGMKIITEYKINEDGKKVKVVMHYKVEKRKVSKAIAKRKTWNKFGLSKNDKPGPSPATTIAAEDVYMQFITNKEDPERTEGDDIRQKLKESQKGTVKCRICREDHWTTQCPYKDTLAPLKDAAAAEEKDASAPAAGSIGEKGGKTIGGKYVPPSLREGGNRKGETMSSNRSRDETATIRVTNLSENTREADLQDLLKPFGSISRIFLAKDKATGATKGFAFISFYKREDAAKAIAFLNGYGYDHLILNVEWSKPSGTQ